MRTTDRASHVTQGTSSRRSSSPETSGRIETRLRPTVLGLDTALRATRPAHSTSCSSCQSRSVRALAIAAATVMMCAQPTQAFSRIWNVNSWGADRLEEVGIRVRACKHRLQSEDPPLEWVEVTFDCSTLPETADVVMTARIISERRTVAAFRAERDREGKDRETLLFAVRPEHRPRSRLSIFIWEETPAGGSEARGYELSVERIVQLARQTTTKKDTQADKQ